MTASKADTVVLLLTSDLMFGSRVQSAAGRAGVLVAASPNSRKLLEVAEGADPTKVVKLAVVDLNYADVDLTGWIESVRKAIPDLPVLAFGSHVLEDKLQGARDAGCTQVLTRGQFDQQMMGILAQVGQA